MFESGEGLLVKIRADTSQYEKQLKQASAVGQQFGRVMAKTLFDAALNGKKLKDVFRELAQSLSQMALKAAMKPVEQAFGNVFGSVFGGLTGVLTGGASGQGLAKFANGGVIGSQTLFPVGNGLMGLAGEAGPEAILPLKRGQNGKLGVHSDGGQRPVTINFNITTSDAESFRRSESQISAMLNRAVSRGNRIL